MREFELAVEKFAAKKTPATMVSVRNIVIDRSVTAFRQGSICILFLPLLSPQSQERALFGTNGLLPNTRTGD